MKAWKSLLKMECQRTLPFWGVVGILTATGTALLYFPGDEFTKLGILLLRHLPIVFGLILGADLAARDQEQKTQSSIAALPLSPEKIFGIRTVIRLAAIIILWIPMVIYTDKILHLVFPNYSRFLGLAQWLQNEIQETSHLSVIIMSIFAYSAGTLCSMFAPDTLTSIGASAALIVAGTLSNSHYKNSYIVTILLLTGVFLGLSVLIYSSRQPWDLKTQGRKLLAALVFIILLFIFI